MRSHFKQRYETTRLWAERQIPPRVKTTSHYPRTFQNHCSKLMVFILLHLNVMTGVLLILWSHYQPWLGSATRCKFFSDKVFNSRIGANHRYWSKNTWAYAVNFEHALIKMSLQESYALPECLSSHMFKNIDHQLCSLSKATSHRYLVLYKHNDPIFS